jgi:hypothetical protein
LFDPWHVGNGGWLSLALAAVLLPVSAGSAWACRCTAPAPRSAFRAANGVVLGRVVSAKPNATGAMDFTLAVTQAWKQPLTGELLVSGNAACSFEPTVGATYVVFLRRTGAGAFETDSCMGNKPEAQAGETLRFLGHH